MMFLQSLLFRASDRTVSQRHRVLIRACHHRGIFPIERAVVAFRPKGQHTLGFPQRFRPIGTTDLIQLRYVPAEGDDRARMPLECYRRQLTANGIEEYGANPPVFKKDALIVPNEDGYGPRLNAAYDPLLAELLIQMHQACLNNKFGRRRQPQRRITLPKIWLGFKTDQRPEFEDSLALRAKAAERLGVTLADLGKNGEVLLLELLRNIWQELWIDHTHAENNTGLDLIETRYVFRWQQAIELYEDFRALRGVVTPNPLWDEQLTPPTISASELRNQLAEYWRSTVTDDELRHAIDEPGDCLTIAAAGKMQIILAAAALV